MLRILRTLAVLGLSAGCINLPSEDEIRDMRVLAVQVDPPEILYSFLHLFSPDQRAGLALGPYNITTRMLVVDPMGRVVELTNRLCPEERNDACPGYRIRDDAPAQEIQDVIPLVTPVQRQAQAQVSLAGELQFAPIHFQISEHAMDYMLPRDARGNLDLLGILFPTFPSVVARAWIPETDEQEVAYKRFSLSMDLNTAGLPAEAQEPLRDIFRQALGFDFCTPEQLAMEAMMPEDPTGLRPPLQCIKERKANRNPTITRMLWTTREPEGGGGGGFGGGGGPAGPPDAGNEPPDPTDDGRFQDVTGRVPVAQGTSITFRPVMADGDHEPYQQFVFDGETGMARIEAYEEDIACIWYTTHGNTNGVNGEGGGFGPNSAPYADGEISIHPDAPEGAAAIWAVCVDQRGGTDWRRIDIEVVSSAGIGGVGLF